MDFFPFLQLKIPDQFPPFYHQMSSYKLGEFIIFFSSVEDFGSVVFFIIGHHGIKLGPRSVLINDNWMVNVWQCLLYFSQYYDILFLRVLYSCRPNQKEKKGIHYDVVCHNLIMSVVVIDLGVIDFCDVMASPRDAYFILCDITRYKALIWANISYIEVLLVVSMIIMLHLTFCTQTMCLNLIEQLNFFQQSI